MPRGKRTVTDEEILEFFEQHADPVYSAPELEPEWDMTEEGIRIRLNDLVERGELLTKKPGSNTRVYWRP